MWEKHEFVRITFLTGLLFLLNGPILISQQFFKFPVTKEGVYHISQEQATNWGLGPLEQISIYGIPGMLPQIVDSSSLELKEIPQKRMGNSLYFFLSQADQILMDGNSAVFEPHHYTDTLHYLIGTGNVPENFVKPASSETFSDQVPATNQPLYRYEHFKIEEDNILTSGRAWYGFRTFTNGSKTISFPKPAQRPDDNLSVVVQVMAQSFGESLFRFALNGEEVGEINVPSIPNSRYAIKGREAVFESQTPFPASGDQLNLRFTYSSTNPNGAGFLKNILIGFPYLGPDWQEGVYYNISENVYSVNSTSLHFWDISDFYNVRELKATPTLQAQASKLVAFDPENTAEILQPKSVKNRSQLISGYPSLIIISAEELWGPAQRLTAFKNDIGMPSSLVALQDIYDTFGYGNPDISSIRNFLALQWHEGKKLQNVLFFGKGSFDYKKKLGGRPNLVPTYSSRNSLNPLTTYGSDDYFGFLTPGKGEWEETDAGDHLLDIGVGRIPAINAREANIAVNKIIHYQTGNPGQWKRKLLFIADDGDNHIHLNDAENHSSYLNGKHPEFELRKLYLDNFDQEKDGDIQTAPMAKAAFARELEEGLLMVNYTGHGNELTWAAENIFSVSDIADWPDTGHYPIFVTATCEFGRHDSPFLRSGAEELLLASNKGAIAVLTTGRPVFSSVNYSLNKAFVEAVFSENGKLTLGEIFKKTKNNSLNGPLNRNFSLLGDPSIMADLPDLTAKTTSLISLTSGIETDTLAGLQKLKYFGEVRDPVSTAKISQFDGKFEIRVESYPRSRETLGDEGPSTSYLEYNQILFRGQGQVKNGQLEGELMLGKLDTNTVAPGKIKLYALDKGGDKEAFGGMEILLGPDKSGIPPENEGPAIEIIFYDSLVNTSSISSRQSFIWVYLRDTSGIQVGHPEGISLQLNDATPVSLVGNYTALSGSFQEGYIKFLISDLQEGENSLIVTARDLLGNESNLRKNIEVRGSQRMQMEEVIGYPNPATDQVDFKITHNRPGENLILNLRVFSLSGSEIFSLQRRFPKAERSIMDIQWIFLQSKTKYPAKGTYLYEINLQSEEDGASERKGGKIIIQ
ncbi:type IX secretion system sortase PorU [Cyclobacterium plantarum]|uniref:Type IX secretion system sortase PorU n=1 Tax=Cyclobacterium plantarum TaxID=2716263 RepID=A0ABX0H221_9BACT|nr:type IX secretion system sortase PorU [Cyclobacterium plantarum]NHE55844.1 type IX secretion system sortase PorU [Cyclobacterium plantarum]